MKEDDLDTNTQIQHWLRRFIHILITLIPVIYYGFVYHLQNLHTIINFVTGTIVILVLLFEVLRLSRGWLIFGQRPYERNQISAFAWGMFSIAIVLLLAPKIGKYGTAYGLPLIWSLALVDPIMGETRRRSLSPNLTIQLGLLFTTLIWVLSAWWLGTPWLLLPFVIPAIVFAETIKIKWVDDNALMLLLPLAIILLWHFYI